MQIESLTFSWINYDQALVIIRDVLAGKYDGERYGSVAPRQLQAPADHRRCYLCA